MKSKSNRREFLATSMVAVTGAAITGSSGTARGQSERDLLYRISLAEWSLHRGLRDGSRQHLDFASCARQEFGIDAVEYVNQFFMDKATDEKYLGEMKQRAEELGVKSLLIMIDNEGKLGDPDGAARAKAVENHYKWIEAAKFLGCHAIRVNAASEGSYEEQQKLASDGLRRLSEFGAQHGLNVIVENHGGLSSNGKWLAGVIELVDLPNCGTLPDFGNFRVGEGRNYDKYQGVQELMPYAKAVSAKSYDFDEHGNETTIDFERMMKIVLDAGYHGYVGIEYEGRRFPEAEGILATRKLLERIRNDLS